MQDNFMKIVFFQLGYCILHPERTTHGVYPDVERSNIPIHRELSGHYQRRVTGHERRDTIIYSCGRLARSASEPAIIKMSPS
jgi:hypothetical protein